MERIPAASRIRVVGLSSDTRQRTAGRSPRGRSSDILGLQRAAGNSAVSRSLPMTSVQRQAHAVANPIPTPSAVHLLGNASRAYYHIADQNAAGNLVLSSTSYGPCVGLAVYRPAAAGPPAVAARGMIVHFWSLAGPGTTPVLRVAAFTADVAAVRAAWGAFQANDVVTFFSGSNPDHQFSQERMAAFPNLLPAGASNGGSHANGDASLDLATGAVA